MESLLPGTTQYQGGTSPAQVLHRRAAQHPDRLLYVFVDAQGHEVPVTYGQFDARVRWLARCLGERVKPGDRALLLFPPGLDYLASFYACLYAGVIAVPLYPPRAKGKLFRAQRVLADCGAQLALTNSEILDILVGFFEAHPEKDAPQLVDLASLDEGAGVDGPVAVAPDSVAFLQYTSGSTGDPKGVMVSHGNLLANGYAQAQMVNLDASDVLVSWLPLYHDMGLIGVAMQAPFVGARAVLMPHTRFIRDPLCWLELISRHKGTFTASPNFGFELCVRRFDEARMASVRLDSWRIALNGSEPVRADTQQRFRETFAAYGLADETLCPGYGLAEATLAVSANAGGDQSFKASKLALAKGRAVATEDAEDTVAVVDCGPVVPHHELVIVDPKTREVLPANRVGEVWFAGPSVAQGYWGRESLSKDVFGAFSGCGRGPFLRTGDLGVLHGKRLFLTGRLKDLIILRGRNYYAHDLEWCAVSSHSALAPDGGAAFSVTEGGEERLVLVQEVKRTARRQMDAEEVFAAMRKALAEQHGVLPHGLVLLRPGQVPKTSSGKIQRRAARQAYLDGTFKTLAVAGGYADEPDMEVVPQDGDALLDWVYALCAKTLGRSPLPRETPLLALGLDSMAAMELVHEVQSAFQIELDPIALEAWSITELAHQLQVAEPVRHAGVASFGSRFPLAPNQLSLFNYEQMQGGNAAYHLPMALELLEPVGVADLERALIALQRRHEILRIRLDMDSGSPMQRVVPPDQPPLWVVDGAAGMDATQVLTEFARRPFEFGQEPPWRVLLYRGQPVVLGFVFHHLVFDHQSFLIFLQDLGSLLAERSAEVLVRPPTRRYADFVAWTHAMRHQAAYAADKAFWLQQHATPVEPLTLSTERATSSGLQPLDLFRWEPGAGLSEATDQLALQLGTTTFDVLISLFAVLLGRYGDSRAFNLGTVVANRPDPGDGDVLGFYANTLALRMELDERLPFSAFMREMRVHLRTCLSHSRFPFQDLLNALPNRSRDGNPLIDVFFVMLRPKGFDGSNALLANDPSRSLDLGGLCARSFPLEKQETQYPLELQVVGGRDGYRFCLEYAADLFGKEAIAIMADRFTQLLRAATLHPQTPVGELSMLSEEALAQWHAHNHQSQPAVPDFRVQNALRKHLFGGSDKLALQAGDVGLSYAELGQRVAALAAELRRIGVRRETVVGLLVDRSIHGMVGLLAILETGGAFLPLDPELPKDRLAYMVSDAGVRVVLNEPQHADILADLDVAQLSCTQSMDEETPTTISVHPLQAMYVIYTSGSTGQPKGVVVTHLVMDNIIGGHLKYYPNGGTTLQFATLAFDMAIHEILGCLCHGETLVLASEAAKSDPEALWELLRDAQIHTAYWPVVMLQHMCESLPQWPLDALALRRIHVSGEQLRMTPAMYAAFGKLPSILLINEYGPSENHVTTVHGISEPQHAEPLPSIGLPVPGVSALVLDRQLRPVGVGMDGELFGGELAPCRGYLDRPGLTAERFLPDPYSQRPGMRMYRTGDKVRRRQDGLLDFLGRMDFQLKIRGFRVEPGEIEACLQESGLVREVAVVPRSGQDGRPALVGFVRTYEGVANLVGALRAYLRERLPEFMVPAHFVLMAEMPLTLSGKVNRQALPKGDLEGMLTRDFLAPETPLQQQIATIWCNVLGIERVGRDAHFFDVGGHSLSAMTLLSQVKQSFGWAPTVKAFFEDATVAGLARFLELSEQLPVAPAPQQGAVVAGTYPQSYAQRRLWFLYLSQPESPWYNMPGHMDLKGAFRPDWLARVFADLMQNQGVLRTSLGQRDGVLFQQVHEDVALPVCVVDLCDFDDAQGRALQLATELNSRPFNLEQAPLWYCLFLRTSSDHWLMVFNMHHIISDGWSIALLFKHLGRGYRQLWQGSDEAGISQPQAQYAQYAVRQQEALTARYSKGLSYWRKTLKGAPTSVRLPFDYSEDPSGRRPYGLVERTLDQGFASRVAALARKHDATSFMVLLAAFKTLLHRYSGAQDLVMGSPLANRNDADLQEVFGFFVNAVVLRTQLAETLSFAQLLRTVRQTCLDGFAYQDLPFDMLVQALQPERSNLEAPLFNIMFALQNLQALQIDLPELEAYLHPQQDQAVKFELGPTFEPLPDGGFQFRLEYDASRFAAWSMESLVSHYFYLIEGLLADDDLRLHQYPLVDPASLLANLQWGLPSQSVSHDLFATFARMAERYPHRVALIDGEDAYSYEELYQRAANVGYSLRTQGCLREEVVALALPRNAHLVVGMLGVLAAGGSWLVLDTRAPEQRRLEMLRNSRVRLLLTENPERGLNHLVQVAITSAQQQPAKAMPLPAWAGQIAYTCYTSGTTGVPKGVMVTQAGVLRLVGPGNRFGLLDGDVMLASAAPAFDAIVLEVWLGLVNGATLVLLAADQDAPSKIGPLIEQHGVTWVHLTAALFRLVVDEQLDHLGSLRCLATGGEAASAAHVQRLLQAWPSLRLINCYGPTETTVLAAVAEVEDLHPRTLRLPIGQALPHARCYVLDRDLRLVPQAVGGQLMVAGSGLARGYEGDPARTAAVFLPDPHGGESGARMYRTGDLVRQTPAGLDFIGRIDTQVKIRGFRIEPAAVETVLLRMENVQQAAVLPVFQEGLCSGLVAYVCLEEAAQGLDLERDQVNHWRDFFDGDDYQQQVGDNPAFNISGWVSRYDGKALGHDEMREWLDDALSRVRALKPQRVLELGCGTGMFVFGFGREVKRYWGLDISRSALAHVERHAKELLPQALDMKLLCRAVDQTDDLPQDFDLVLINSVLQYFPGEGYLEKVLAGALERLSSGGSLYLGDVRHLGLLPHLEADVLVKSTGKPGARLVDKLQAALARESEFLVHPHWFFQWAQRHPQVGHVSVLVKEMSVANELSAFRYDVRVHCGAVEAETLEPYHWNEDQLSLDQLTQRLESMRETVAIRGIPNGRIENARHTLEALGEAGFHHPGLELEPKEWANRWVDPHALVALAQRFDCSVSLQYAPGDPVECFAAVFHRKTHPVFLWPVVALESGAYIGNPLKRAQEAAMADSLREDVRKTLPDYMVPEQVVVLDALPRTVSGKVDRGRLLQLGRVTHRQQRKPLDPLEVLVADVFQQVLNIARVGADDHFFDLGGHSLLATRVVTRLSKQLHRQISVASLFKAPTVAGFAQALRVTSSLPDEPLITEEVLEHPPLSFAQQSLWLHYKVHGPSPTYNIPGALAFKGPLDVFALESALRLIAKRHAVVRTVIGRHEGKAIQVVTDRVPRLRFIDLQHLENNQSLATHLHEAEEMWCFHLEEGPLMRSSLFRLAPQHHVLLVNKHHIMSDGWSHGVIIRELTAGYNALVSGNQPDLPNLATSYGRYATWERARWEKGGEERLLAYWTHRLKGAPELLALPTDRPRPAQQDMRGSGFSLSLGLALSQQLDQVARVHQVTPFVVGLCAFATVLHRLSGQDDFVVGTPVANRNQLELESLIGFFVNMLALRIDCSQNPNLRQFLGGLKESVLADFAHSEAPFDQVLNALDVNRNLAHAPVFQVSLAWQNVAVEDPEMLGLSIARRDRDSQVARWDLSVSVTRQDGILHLSYEFGSQLFDKQTIMGIHRAWCCIVEHLAQGADQRLSQLPLINPADINNLLHAQRGLPLAITDTLMHQIWERWAPQSEKTGLVFHDQPDDVSSYSHQQLDWAANRLAHRIRALGVGPDRVVGIYLQPSPQLYVAVLAVLKAGGTWMPLDPTYPAERLAFMAEDSKCVLVVCMAELLPPMPDVAQVDVTDALAEPLYQAVSPQVDLCGEHGAYVIYTSGSTGRPKGVLVSHFSAVNTGYDLRKDFAVDADSVILHITSPGFDVWVMDLHLWLGNGCQIHTAPRQHLLPGPHLHSLLENTGVTVLMATPSLLAALAHLPASLKMVLSGGEALAPVLAARLSDGPTLWNGYGPTETSILVTKYAMHHTQESMIPIGLPLANMRFSVVDAHLHLLPTGFPGEGVISGPGLARGYLDRPALTASKFLPDPFAEKPGERMYRTGDLIRMDQQQRFHFLGRIDHQIKLRGHRIECEEIEAVLCDMDEIEAAVVSLRTIAGEQALIGWLVGGEEHAQNVRAHLHTYLPDYMVPQSLIWVDHIPIAPGGKRNLKALPDPVPAVSNSRAPETEIERQLAQLWSEILDVEVTGVDDNFFALGGHSLKATRVVTRIGEVFGQEIQVRDLFEKPTIAGLAELIRAWCNTDDVFLPQPRPTDGPAWQSLAQVRLYKRDQVEGTGAAYNMPFAFSMTGSFSVLAMEQTFNHIRARHDILRSRFGDLDDVHVFWIDPLQPQPVTIIDLSGISGADHHLERIADDDHERPFDLRNGPIFRAAIVRTSPEHHGMLLNLHHIISDGWSAGIMFSEIAGDFTAFSRGMPSPYIRPELQFADYAHWERTVITEEVQVQQLAYWQKRLAGIPRLLEMPMDRPHPKQQSYQGADYGLTYDATLATDLHELCAREGVTLYMVMITGLACVFHTYSGQTDIIMASPVALRRHKAWEKMLGLFLNGLLLRTDLAGNPTLAQLLHSVRDNVLEGFANMDVTLERVVRAVIPEDPDPAYNPVFQFMFILQNMPGMLDTELKEVKALTSSTIMSKYDMALSMSEDGDALDCNWVYKKGLFDHETIVGIDQRLQQILHYICHQDQMTLDQLIHSIRTKHI